MITQILIACALFLITILIHASGMLIGLRFIVVINNLKPLLNASLLARLITLAAFIIILFIATLIETGIWALAFMKVGAIPDYLEAFYFATVTYTTLGYGDIVLDKDWRLLSSFTSVNGVIMFGWTTALVIVAIHKFSKILSDFEKEV